MTDEPRVRELLEEILDSERTPEQVCAGCPELLWEVRKRWQQMLLLKAELAALFPAIPNPDAIQEFKVQTSTYDASYGRNPGANVNVITKSGTNSFHGSLFEFFRNKVLDANQWINNVAGLPRGGFSQNQFGGTIGGPIRKDKLFFFGDFARFTSRDGATELSTVPTPLMDQGNFTELPFALTNPIQIPSQANCYVGNIIQPGCFDPVAQKFLALVAGTAVPNLPAAVAVEGQPGSWTGAANYAYPTSIPNDQNSLDARIDYNMSSKDQIFGSYSYRHVDRQDPLWTSDPLIGNGQFATQYRWHQQSLALGWTHTLSSSLVNDLEIPTIGLLNGSGFHSEIVLMCDITLAADDARIFDLHFDIGSVPADGIHNAFQELLGTKRAAYALLTGQALTAQQALDYGLVNEIMPRDQLISRAYQIADHIMGQPRTTRRLTTQIVRRPWKQRIVNDLDGGFGIQMFGHVAKQKTIHERDHIAGTVDYVRQNRPNNFD